MRLCWTGSRDQTRGLKCRRDSWHLVPGSEPERAAHPAQRPRFWRSAPRDRSEGSGQPSPTSRAGYRSMPPLHHRSDRVPPCRRRTAEALWPQARPSPQPWGRSTLHSDRPSRDDPFCPSGRFVTGPPERTRLAQTTSTRKRSRRRIWTSTIRREPAFLPLQRHPRRLTGSHRRLERPSTREPDCFSSSRPAVAHSPAAPRRAWAPCCSPPAYPCSSAERWKSSATERPPRLRSSLGPVWGPSSCPRSQEPCAKRPVLERCCPAETSAKPGPAPADTLTT